MTDPDTGLVHFGWRDYDPTIGRFTALDPAKDRRGDGDLYDYCIDDPVSRVDPTGLWSKENFDESKVSRDGLGQFASTPGGGGSGVQMAVAHGSDHSTPGQITNQTQPSHRNFHEEARETLELVQVQEPELSFVDALVTGLGNIPESGADFIGDLRDAVLNYDQTLDGMGNIVAGYGCQIFGIESESRLYSDAVTEYYRKRYGSYADFKKALAKDPVGVAADLSLFLTAGASVLRGLAKAGTTASKVMTAGALVQEVEKMTRLLQKTGTGMKTLGTVMDPLYLPGKYMGKAVGATGIHSSIPEFIRDNSPKIGTAVSRAKTIIGAGGTLNAIKREQEQQKTKK